MQCQALASCSIPRGLVCDNAAMYNAAAATFFLTFSRIASSAWSAIRQQSNPTRLCSRAAWHPVSMLLVLILTLIPALSLCTAASAQTDPTGKQEAAPEHHLPKQPIIDLQAFPEMVGLDGRSLRWVDKNSTFSVEQMESSIEALPMQRYFANDLIDLSNQAALWIRFSVRHHAGDGPWELEVRWAGIDDIRFYHQDAQGQWKFESAGDLHPVSSWPIPERFPVFPIPARGDAFEHYWLRIEHRNMPFSGEIVLHHQHHLRQLRTVEQVLLGGFFGMALLLSAIALTNAAVFKDRASAAFAAYNLTLALQLAAATGLGGLLLWPDSPRWNSVSEFVLLPIFCVAGIHFFRVLFLGILPRWVDRFSVVLVPVFVALTVWHAIAWSQLTANAVYAAGAATVFLLLVSVWHGWRTDENWSRWILLGMLPLGLAGTLIIMRSLGLVANTFWPQYAMLIAAAIQGPSVLTGLLRRSSAQYESQARARALNTNEPLTGLSNRHQFTVRLHDTLSRATRYQYRCALLLVELDNHEWFVTQYGREVSDRALVLTASLLRSVARDMDAAARIDDASMALLLEGPVRPPQVMAVATSLLARSLRPSDELPSGTALQLKVVMVMLPDADPSRSLDAQKHLEWLQQAMANLRNEDRRAIVALNF